MYRAVVDKGVWRGRTHPSMPLFSVYLLTVNYIFLINKIVHVKKKRPYPRIQSSGRYSPFRRKQSSATIILPIQPFSINLVWISVGILATAVNMFLLRIAWSKVPTEFLPRRNFPTFDLAFELLDDFSPPTFDVTFWVGSADSLHDDDNLPHTPSLLDLLPPFSLSSSWLLLAIYKCPTRSEKRMMCLVLKFENKFCVYC